MAYEPDTTIRCCASCVDWAPNGETEFGACRNSNSPRFNQHTQGARITCKGHRLIPFEPDALRARLIEERANG